MDQEVIRLNNVSLWRRTQEEFSYDLNFPNFIGPKMSKSFFLTLRICDIFSHSPGFVRIKL